MIDEKKLIEELEKIFETDEENINCTLSDFAYHVFDCIKSQPKVGEWIPCSEQFPEESGTYIVNAIENHIVHVTFAKWMPRMKRWNLSGNRSYWKVTAWMPLPNPYRPEKEDE